MKQSFATKVTNDHQGNCVENSFVPFVVKEFRPVR
jgi:hypothetical protein